MGRYKSPARCAAPVLKQIFDTADERGMSMAAMAAKMDVHPNQIANWRAGRISPGIFAVMEMAKTLGMEIRLVTA